MHRKAGGRLRMMRRRTWQELWPVALVAFTLGLIVAITGIGLLRAALTVVLPGLLVAGALWVGHTRRVRAVGREAEAGIRSLESWLERYGRGRRS
jgi:hypothetical protein